MVFFVMHKPSSCHLHMPELDWNGGLDRMRVTNTSQFRVAMDSRLKGDQCLHTCSIAV